MNSRLASLVDVILFSIFLSLFVLPTVPPKVETQNCPNITPADPFDPQRLCWPAGATIRYFFTWVPDGRPFTQQELTLYTQAFNAWNQHNGLNHNCSGVVFSPSYGDYSCEVRKVSDQQGWYTNRFTNGSYETSVMIEVGGTNPYPETDALKKTIMLHEIGHSFGMNHCNCSPCNGSVMTYCNPPALFTAPTSTPSAQF
jgi:hypothetical protein